jgi:hypothetical protein
MEGDTVVGRNPHYGSRHHANLKTRLGIATAVLVGGGAIGVAAVATTSHPQSAAQAGYHYSYGSSEGNTLNSALSDWSWSQSRSLSLLQSLSLRTESESWHQKTQFAAQRGVVLLATKKFIIVESANKQIHLWWLSGNTHVKNVSSSYSGTAALTGSSWAAGQAMSNNFTPVANQVAGSTTLVSQVVTPAPVAQTVSVTVAGTGITVTVTVTSTTATVAQTNTNLFSQSVFTPVVGVARGDLVFVAGVRKNHELRAQLVLFAAPTTTFKHNHHWNWNRWTRPTPTATPTVTATATPTATPTVTATPTATPTPTSTYHHSH